jgi:hypothetical protein
LAHVVHSTVAGHGAVIHVAVIHVAVIHGCVVGGVVHVELRDAGLVLVYAG